MTIDELAARRAGKREANLRELNERIADAQERAGNDSTPLTLVCECAIDQCQDGIDVEAAVFARLREDDHRFLVSPGHVLQEVEQPCESGDGWVVVEKIGVAARAAEQELS